MIQCIVKKKSVLGFQTKGGKIDVGDMGVKIIGWLLEERSEESKVNRELCFAWF